MRVPSTRSNIDLTENMMTSMIDVVFLLLIFFLVAAAGRRSEAMLPTDLGAGGIGVAGASERPKTEELWIRAATATTGATEWTLNDTTYQTAHEVRGVLSALSELQPDMPVILDTGPEVPAGDLIEIYDACRAAGLTDVNFNLAPDKAASAPLPIRSR